MLINCSSTILLVLFAQVPDGNREFIAVVDGYCASLAKFDQFRCKYGITGCSADTLADVYLDRHTSRSERVDFANWIVKGRGERWIYEPNPTKAEIEAKRVASPEGRRQLLPKKETLVSNGTFSVRFGEHIHAAIASEGDGKDIGTPLNMGYFVGTPLTKYAELCRIGEFKAEYLGTVDVRSRKTMAFRVGKPAGPTVLQVYFDPQRGFLPIRFEQVKLDDGQITIMGLMTNIVEYAGRGWFPHRSVAVIFPGDLEKGPFGFREFKILEFDADCRIADGDMQITIPKNYQMSIRGDNWSLGIASKGRNVSPDSIPALLNEIEASGEKWKKYKQDVDAKAWGETAGIRRWSMILLPAIIAALSIGAIKGYGYYRRRKGS